MEFQRYNPVDVWSKCDNEELESNQWCSTLKELVVCRCQRSLIIYDIEPDDKKMGNAR